MRATNRPAFSIPHAGLSTAPAVSLDQGIVTTQLVHVAARQSAVALPILLVIVAAAVVSNLLQAGFLWVPTAVLPQFERLDPARGFGRWWAMHSWVGLFWSVVKLAVLLGVLVVHVRIRLASAGPLVEGSPPALLSLTARLMGELAIVLSLSLVVLAILDYAYQFWRQERQLMMTLEEVRREQRENEADPRWKRQRRELAASGAATRDVGGADGVRPV